MLVESEMNRDSEIVAPQSPMSVFKCFPNPTQGQEMLVGQHELLLTAKRKTEEAKHLRILFVGETGVGKTPFARYSNQIVSRREGGKKRPFEQVNCACLNREQFQDILFGHKKGAFTSAISDKAGLVELAAGGDLFLDEIGEMSLEVQAHFLTFLDTMEYYRLGDDRKRKANVRVLCATNRDLKQMVSEGKFRKDLYSRISQVVVHIPALRHRASDIKSLVEFFIQSFTGIEKAYQPELVSLLENYSWEEGNVRELKDAVEYLCLMSQDSHIIEAAHLGDRYRNPQGIVPTPGLSSTASLTEVYDSGLEGYLDRVEREVLRQLLANTNGCMETLARQLKTSRSTLYRRIKKLGL